MAATPLPTEVFAVTITTPESQARPAGSAPDQQSLDAVVEELIKEYGLDDLSKRFLLPASCGLAARLVWGKYSKVVTALQARFRWPSTTTGALNAAEIAALDTTNLPMDRTRELIEATNGASATVFDDKTESEAAEIIFAAILVKLRLVKVDNQ